MLKFLKRIWDKIKYKMIAVDGIDNPVQQTTRVDSVKECTRDKATRARVAKAFESQQQQMQARALKAHEPTCDPLSCDKNICFKRQPDQIKKRTTVTRPMTRLKAKLACRKKEE